MSEDNKPIKPKKEMSVDWSDSNPEANELLQKADKIVSSKEAAMQYFNIDNTKENQTKKAPPKLALNYDPNLTENTTGVKSKTKGLLPDSLIKEIASSNHLIASILRGWSNAVSMFGNFKKDRFDIGTVVKIKPDFERDMTPEQISKVKDRIEKFKILLMSCGYTEGLAETNKMGFATFLYSQTHNALRFGRMGTEVVRQDEESESTGRYHRHRPVDIGTIYRTFKSPKGEVQGLRNQVALDLSNESDEKIKSSDLPAVEDNELYPWVQMTNGFKKQFFSEKELLVYTFYPSTDVEHNGYPLTPIDTCITSITTHLSIEAYTKLFFLNGRGSKGILVIQSDEVDQGVLEDFKQQFNATINNVNNSFKTPIFGVSKDDTIQWQAIDAPSKDGEFQFLYDQVSRNILSSFGMSPDELPGYGHLSKGTNNQSLSESNNEFKLTAARDMGLRPLIMKMQTFLNEQLFPAMDAELAQLCIIELSGMDAQSRDQENTRLAQEQGIHMTYNETLVAVEKDPIGDHLGGNVPLNPAVQAVLDKYSNVGSVVADLMSTPAAAVDPLLRYRRDPFYIQHLTILQQIEPYAVKAAYAVNPMQMEILKMFLEDYLNEDEIQEEKVEEKIEDINEGNEVEE